MTKTSPPAAALRLLMALVLAVGLMPLPAYAELGAGSLVAQDAPTQSSAYGAVKLDSNGTAMEWWGNSTSLNEGAGATDEGVTIHAAIYEDGCLVIEPTNGATEAVLPNSTGAQNWRALLPWSPSSGTDLTDYMSAVTSIEIADGVTADGISWYFRGMVNLASVNRIPDGVTNMSGCFRGCSSLSAAPAIPEGVTNLSTCFSDCSSLSAAPAIPEGVTSLSSCFKGCTSLAEAPLVPSTVTNMNNAFNGCTSLVSLPAGWSFPKDVDPAPHMFITSNEFDSSNLLATYCAAADFEALSAALDWGTAGRQLVARGDDPQPSVDPVKAGNGEQGGVDYAWSYGGNITYADGTGFTVTPYTADGITYVIDTIVVDGQAVDLAGVDTTKAYTLTAAPTSSVFATFAYVVNFNSPDNGTLSVARADGTVLKSGSIVRGGEVLTITADPADGYEMDGELALTGLTAVGGGQDNAYRVTAVNGEATPAISVAFKEIPAPTFSAAVADGVQNGTVSLVAPQGKELSSLSQGDAVTVTAAPAEGYELSGVWYYTTDASAKTTVEPAEDAYSFAMPAADVTVGADFAKTAGPEPDPVHGEVVGGQWEIGSPNAADVTAVLYADGCLAFRGTGATEWLNMSSRPWSGQASSVTSYEFAEGVAPTAIDNWFAGTSIVVAPALPSSVTSMVSAFSGCTALEQAPAIPDGVANLQGCFNGCTALAAAPAIPDGVTNLNSAFNGCTALAAAPLVPSSVTSMRTAFFGCTSLTELPEGFAFPSGADTTQAFMLYGAAVATYCSGSDYGTLVDAYDWSGSNRELKTASEPSTVTVVTGAHMASSGTLVQEGLTGPMSAVTVTPEAGYAAVKPAIEPAGGGVTAAYADGAWTVSGTPTADVTVTFADAVAFDGTVSTADGLLLVKQLAEQGALDPSLTIRLGADIDAAGTGAEGISMLNDFDGCGYEVTGVSDTLFQQVGTVSNLTVRGEIAQAAGDLDAGVVLNAENVIGCTSYVSITGTGVTASSGGEVSRAAGIVYNLAADGKAEGCTNYGVISYASPAAGIVAYAGDGATVSGCANYADITGEAPYVLYGSAAGIVANAEGTITITGCANKGAVSAKSGNGKDQISAAGILAGPTATAAVAITDCYNTGVITREGGGGYPEYTASAAGIVCQPLAGNLSDSMQTGVSVSNCYNTGAVESSKEDGRGEIAPDLVLWGVRDNNGTYAGTAAFALSNNYGKAELEALDDAVAALGGAYRADVAGANPGSTPLLAWESGEAPVLETVTVAITVEPTGASLSVTYGGEAVAPEADGTYALVKGRTYDWSAELEGYFPRTGEFKAAEGLALNIALEPAEGYDGLLYGGEAVDVSGKYRLADDATGAITLEEGVAVEIVGASYDPATGGFTGPTYRDLSISVGDGSALTLRDVHVELSTKSAPSAVDFAGAGRLDVEGANLIDRSNDVEAGQPFPAVIHVGPEASATFGGTGTLYGYKYSLGAYIGADAYQNDAGHPGSEANGAITFESGTWLLKGSQTGAVIGSDAQDGAKGGVITVDGGALYVKTVSQGAAIGSSRAGNAGPDVVVNGGMVLLATDFSASAIGWGGQKKGDPGTLTVNGGSLMTVVTPNAYSAWGVDAGSNWGSVATSANVTAAHGYAMLRLPTEAYAGEASIAVAVDGSAFYEGAPYYAWTANEVKNPDGPYSPSTLSNWLPNETQWALERYDGAYPAEPGSSLAGESALYLWLPAGADHAVAVDGESFYKAVWDAWSGSFSLAPDEGAQAAHDAERAAEVESLIGALPEDVITPEGMEAVEAALDAYQALTDAQRALVGNVGDLLAAQRAVAAAKVAAVAAEADAARADADSAKSEADAQRSRAEAAEEGLAAKVSEAVAAQARAAELQKQAEAAQAAQKAAEAKAAQAAQRTDISKATVTVAGAAYTGKALEPAVTVKLAGKALKAGTDYEVSYVNNVNAGTGVAVVAGRGSYAGAATKAFAIAKAKNTLTAKAKAKVAKVSYKKAAKKAQALKRSKAFVVKNAKGKLSFKVAKYGKNAKKYVKVASNGKVTVRKGAKKGTYTLKVKVTAAGNANYKAASKTVTLKVRVK